MMLPSISPLINNAFNIAKVKYHAEYIAWTSLSGKLAGRFNLTVAVSTIQRLGDVDLLLKCIEDEFEANRAVEEAGAVNMMFGYQIFLSETWIVGWYEILRVFRQRDGEALKAGTRPSGISDMEAFKSIFANLELLRMPMAKFQIAKEMGKTGLVSPIRMQKLPPNNDATDEYVYNREDPVRSHIMPTRWSPRGSLEWLALDHRTMQEHWLERRKIS
jgi:hypothetical protein